MPSSLSPADAATLAQYRTLMREFSAQKKQQSIAQGEAFGKLPIGYRYDRYSGAVAVDKSKASLVLAAFELACKRGMTLRKLLPEVRRMGLKSSRGEPIALATLFRMLTNPFYMGTITYKEKRYQGNHAPLVSEKLFRQVQENLGKRNKRTGTK